MADKSLDIDLYAVDVESDLNRQDEFHGENFDHYDDVIVPVKTEDGAGLSNSSPHAVEQTNGNSNFPNNQNHGHHGRFFVYIGNLTWWTTDDDIVNAIADIGITDFKEIKFFEKNPNGQSKGECMVCVGSEESRFMALERLPKKEIHGQLPVVTLPTKQALSQFENQSQMRSAPPGPNFDMRGPHFGMGGPRGPPHHEVTGLVPGGPAPHVNPAFFNQQPPVHPSPGVQPTPQLAPGPGRPYGHPPPSQSPPPGARPPYEIPPQAVVGAARISEAKFEEVMSRNHAVSSTAVLSAVFDACTGEFASAIKTIVDVISVINQSEVASDDRCQRLISSLQNTLRCIENKSNTGEFCRCRSEERQQSAPNHPERSASRDRERHYRENLERERDRSRSRDNYNKSLSRE